MDMKYQIHTDGLKISQAMILLIGLRNKINLLKHLSVKISTKKILQTTLSKFGKMNTFLSLTKKKARLFTISMMDLSNRVN